MSEMLHKRRQGPHSADSSADVSEASDFDDELSGTSCLRTGNKTMSEMHLLRMNESFETEKLFPTVGASKKKNVTELVELPNDIIFATVGTAKRSSSARDAADLKENPRSELSEKLDSTTSSTISNNAEPNGLDDVFYSESNPMVTSAAEATATKTTAAEIPIRSGVTTVAKTPTSLPAASETSDGGAVVSGSSREFAVSRALARYRQRQNTQSTDNTSGDAASAAAEDAGRRTAESPPNTTENLTTENGENGETGENGCVPRSSHDAPPESPSVDKVALQRLKEQFTALSRDYLQASNSNSPAGPSRGSYSRNGRSPRSPRRDFPLASMSSYERADSVDSNNSEKSARQLLGLPSQRTFSEEEDSRSMRSYRSSRVSSRRQSTTDESIDSDDEWYRHELKYLQVLENEQRIQQARVEDAYPSEPDLSVHS